MEADSTRLRWNKYNTLTVPRQVFQFVTLRDLFIQIYFLFLLRRSSVLRSSNSFRALMSASAVCNLPS